MFGVVPDAMVRIDLVADGRDHPWTGREIRGPRRRHDGRRVHLVDQPADRRQDPDLEAGAGDRTPIGGLDKDLEMFSELHRHVEPRDLAEWQVNRGGLAVRQRHRLRHGHARLGLHLRIVRIGVNPIGGEGGAEVRGVADRRLLPDVDLVGRPGRHLLLRLCEATLGGILRQRGRARRRSLHSFRRHDQPATVLSGMAVPRSSGSSRAKPQFQLPDPSGFGMTRRTTRRFLAVTSSPSTVTPYVRVDPGMVRWNL